jgi:hypothetical protein
LPSKQLKTLEKRRKNWRPQKVYENDGTDVSGADKRYETEKKNAALRLFNEYGRRSNIKR